MMITNRRMKLWYDKPAQHWLEALPLGNGRIGVMVSGDAYHERITLNEDTLWSGYPRDENIKGACEQYRKAATFAMQGDYEKSQRTIEKGMLGSFTQAYLPLGEIQFDFHNEKETSKYYRELDIEQAISSAQFSKGGVQYRQETFVSAPDSAVVIRFEANQAASIDLNIIIKSKLRHSVRVEVDQLILDGIAPSHVAPIYMDSSEPIIYCDEKEKQGMSFRTVVDIENNKGRIEKQGDALRITQADSVTIRICVRTSFSGFDKHPQREGKDYRKICAIDLKNVKKREYACLKERHIADFRSFFDRMAIDLGTGLEELPTDRRLAKADKANDLGLYALLFQYGRYLMIASSREGSQATNLQGIWNNTIRAPWSANYTLNINTQMNYWLAESCNLAEMHRPLFDLIEKLCVTGSRTAIMNYEASGFTAHHNSDVWAHSSPVGKQGKNTATYGFWPLAAGWLCRHLFEHYEYSLDEEFLKTTAFPLLKSASDFFLDVLQQNGDDTLIFCPSTSPENTFRVNGNDIAVAKSTTMTTAIIRETFENMLTCCDRLGIKAEYAAKIEKVLSKLPPYAIGSKGQLLEWNEEFEEADPQHRHTSHLYPLFPANHVDPETEPELARACRKSLELRGEEGTGWALAWRMCLWARLCDGNKAFDFLNRQLRLVDARKRGYGECGGSYPNLLGAHPPFQIDSNFGVCAGMAEMFIQSRGAAVYLLPALPDAFQSGFIHGLRAKGGLCVDIDFEQGRLKKAVFFMQAKAVKKFDIHYAGKKQKITLGYGQHIELIY